MKQKTENELFVLKNYMHMTKREMANELNISIPAIEYYLKKNDIHRCKFKFSKEENDFIREHYKDMTYKEIANILGYTEKQIRSRANHMCLTNVRKINDTYFNFIDTPLKAYFLGFIYADGWIHIDDRHYEFGMELQHSDRYILEKLNDELGGLNNIVEKDPKTKIINGNLCHSGKMSRLRIYSKQLVMSLKQNGIETNKTLKTVFPIVSNEYFFDFLRGYIDGDGCFWKYKNHYYMHLTSANDSILNYIHDKLLNEYGITTRIYKEKDKKYRLMCINIHDMGKLIPLLYYDSGIFCLNRKYELVKSYLGSAI